MVGEMVVWVLSLFCVVFRWQVSIFDNIWENIFIPLLQNVLNPLGLIILTFDKYFFAKSEIRLVINARARPNTCFRELGVI
jgi:hypothetical protein